MMREKPSGVMQRYQMSSFSDSVGGGVGGCAEATARAQSEPMTVENTGKASAAAMRADASIVVTF
jgi:hypothetical protein